MNGVMPSELRRRHSTREIDDATCAWAILVEFADQPRSYRQGHRVAAGKSSRSRFEPRGAAQQYHWLAIFENLRNTLRRYEYGEVLKFL